MLNHPYLSRQQGFALLELAFALLIAMLLAVFAADRLAERSHEIMAEGHAAWMVSLHGATLKYLEQHMVSLAAGGAEPIEGFANALAPTQAELKAAGLLAAGFPTHGARGVGAHIQLLRHGNCPSEGCRIEALIYSDTPLGQEASRAHNLSMVAHWLGVSKGWGGAVMPDRSQVVAGAAFSFPNPPVGDMAPLPAGTVAMAATTEQLASLAYLRVRDQRDPNFQGSASVAGNINTQAALNVKDYLFIDTQAYAQTFCDTPGAIVRERYGGLLVCGGGLWRSAGGSGGGGFSLNSETNCVAATANPVTGDCSCAANYTPVRIVDTVSAVPSEGRTRGYLCVG